MQNFKRPELAKRPDKFGTEMFEGSICRSLGQAGYEVSELWECLVLHPRGSRHI